MKIKLKKDIPGYKAGEITLSQTDFMCNPDIQKNEFRYNVPNLIKDGWAEEVIEEIDMEEVRDKFGLTWETNGVGPMLPVLHKVNETEAKSFTAYRIVKHVIDTLNGGWKPVWKDTHSVVSNKWTIIYGRRYNKFIADENQFLQSLSLYMKDESTAEKVIELCKPELKVLFNVK